MNPYLEPQGFLGTGASLLADLSLLAYILLIIPGMLIGFVFAKRGMHRPAHKWTMIGITAFNWILIIFLMLVAYRFDISDNVLQRPGNARYLLPSIHGLLGISAQLLATYVVYRMLREDILVARGKRRGESKEQLQRYWFLNAKPIMRVTLLLWIATALLGILSYTIRYEILPSAASPSTAPVVTEEPAATVEPAITVEPAVTVEAFAAPLPAVTVEVLMPAVTPESDDDNNSGMGSDDDNDNSGMGSG